MKNFLFSIFYFLFSRRRGQVMILTILVLGGAILLGTTIAGLLMVYQIRQSTDLAGSAKAVFAADSGIEWGLYQFFKGSSAPPIFSNGALVNAACYDSSRAAISCADSSAVSIRAIGKAGSIHRAFEQKIQ